MDVIKAESFFPRSISSLLFYLQTLILSMILQKSIQNFVHFIYIYPETKSLKNLQKGFTISLVANKIFYNG